MNFTKRQIFGIIFGIFFTFYSLYYHGIIGAGVSIVYILAASGMIYLWRNFKKTYKKNFSSIIADVYYRLSISLLVVAMIIGTIGYYANNIHPAEVSRYTLTDGKKTIIFQGMSHIADQKFYDTIIDDISHHKKEGFVLFWEGIRPGKQESYEILNQAMGIKFDEKLYENMSELIGITHQKHKDFLGIVNDKDYNTDISIDELANLYKNTPAFSTPPTKIQDINANIEMLQNNLSPLEKKVLAYWYRSLFNLILMNQTATDFLQNQKSDIFEIILHKRNHHLVEKIIQSDFEKIYITYGMLHFEGVLELLQKNNPEWKIISETKMYPLKK